MRGAAPVYDRYGGGVVHAPIARAASPYAVRATTYTGPRMAWGGKTVEPPMAEAPSSMAPRPWRTTQGRDAYASPTAAPRARLQYPSMAMVETAQAASIPAATPETYAPPTYVPPVYAKPTRRGAAPTSIYDPAPPPSVPANATAASQTPTMPGPPVRLAATAPGDGPRLYSLHRDYGMAPDPIPLAPQFFGPTADLTTPETPEVGRRTRTSTGALVNAPTDAESAQ